jgi:ankyrin repeat protein
LTANVLIGANANKLNRAGSTALHFAAIQGHCEAAIALFKGYPYINVEAKDDRNYTPLINAAKNGKIEFIKCLISYHPDVAVPPSKLAEAASYAGKVGKRETRKFLLRTMKGKK